MTTRRQLLKAGLLGGAYALWVRQGRAQTAGGQLLTPFRDPLPLPPAPREIEPHRAGPVPRDFRDLDPVCAKFIDLTGLHGRPHFYKIASEVRRVQFHSELPPTEIWGYRDGTLPPGSWPFALGPTFVTHICENTADGTIVRHTNQLPPVADHAGFGEPRTTVHLHGGHHPAHSDGFPADIVLPDGRLFRATFSHGEHFDYCYPMVDPGFEDDPRGDKGERDFTERPSTLWYHDHLLDFTGANVYRGLAAFHLVYEDPKSRSPLVHATARDTGDETNADNLPVALRLPSGPYDIPLAFHDKTFAADGSLVFDPFNFDGFLGEQALVNGAVQPFLAVKRRKYRFRVLNAMGARLLQLFLTDADGNSYPLTQIATEGGLLSRPVERANGIMLGVAERFEVVIDFSRFPHPRFKELYLENRLAQVDGRGPKGTFDDPELLSSGTRFIKFVLEEEVRDPSRVPAELRPFKPISTGELSAATLRTFEFNRSHGLWTINGEVADPARPLAQPKRDGPEIWRLVNKSGGWWHPIHVHDEFGRVLRRNGMLPFDGRGRDHGQSLERDGLAKKDTIILGPNDEVDVFLKFRDFVGPYVFHCHNLAHEDHAMMGRFDVT